MKLEKLVDGLALLGVAIVLIGVTSAANSALADDAGAFDATLKIEASSTN